MLWAHWILTIPTEQNLTYSIHSAGHGEVSFSKILNLSFNLIFFKIFFFEKQSDREAEDKTKKSFIHWFTFQMSAPAGTRAGWSQESIWVSYLSSGAQAFDPSSPAFPDTPLPGSCIVSRAAETWSWRYHRGSSTVGGCLTCSATMWAQEGVS